MHAGVWLVVRTRVALCSRNELWIVRDSLAGWVCLLLSRLALLSSLQDTGSAGHGLMKLSQAKSRAGGKIRRDLLSRSLLWQVIHVDRWRVNWGRRMKKKRGRGNMKNCTLEYGFQYTACYTRGVYDIAYRQLYLVNICMTNLNKTYSHTKIFWIYF